MFSDSEKEAILRSWKLVVPIAETAADLFYKRLFELEPSYRALFPEDLTAQKRKLIRMLAFIVKSLSWKEAEWKEDVRPEEDLMLVMLALGRRHAELYKIPRESYDKVAEALLWTLDYGLGGAFTPEVRAAWTRVYTLVAQAMQMGTASIDRESAAAAPEAALAVGEAVLREHEQANSAAVDIEFVEDAP